MQSLRQVGFGIFFLLISIYIVAGGYVLATSQGKDQGEAISTVEDISTATAGVMATITPAVEPLPVDMATATVFVQEATSTPQPPPTMPPSTATSAPLATTCPIPAGWFPIAVGANDTVDIIANAYHMNPTELMQGNCLSSPQLQSITVIYVTKVAPTQTQPVQQAATATAAVPVKPTSTTSSKNVCGAPAGWVNYSVIAGDTLYNIGWRYRVTVQDLQQANCLSTTNIRVGQVLKVPNVATSIPLTTATKTSTPALSLPSQTPIILPTLTILPPTETAPASVPTAIPVNSPTPTTFTGIG